MFRGTATAIVSCLLLAPEPLDSITISLTETGENWLSRPNSKVTYLVVLDDLIPTGE